MYSINNVVLCTYTNTLTVTMQSQTKLTNLIKHNKQYPREHKLSPGNWNQSVFIIVGPQSSGEPVGLPLRMSQFPIPGM